MVSRRNLIYGGVAISDSQRTAYVKIQIPTYDQGTTQTIPIQ